MTAFTTNVVKLSGTGTPASITLLAGEQVNRGMLFVNSTDEEVNLTGYNASALGEWHEAFWNADDTLAGIGEPVEPVQHSVMLSVTIHHDQITNTGLFTVFIPGTVLPDALLDINYNAPILPTLLTYIRFAAPGVNSAITQARLAIGYRRGYRSIS